MKPTLFAVGPARVMTVAVAAQPRTIDNFFTTFTTEWVRINPDQATSARFFAGEEQRRLERQTTSATRAFQLTRIALAKEGLAELATFDRSRLSESERTSADLMQWQLQTFVEGASFLDYSFRSNSFRASTSALSPRSRPLIRLLSSDANNYVARLGQVAARMNEAIEEARRIAVSGRIPPRFILQLTIRQMQDFMGAPAADNSDVTTPGRLAPGAVARRASTRISRAYHGCQGRRRAEAAVSQKHAA